MLCINFFGWFQRDKEIIFTLDNTSETALRDGPADSQHAKT